MCHVFVHSAFSKALLMWGHLAPNYTSCSISHASLSCPPPPPLTPAVLHTRRVSKQTQSLSMALLSQVRVTAMHQLSQGDEGFSSIWQSRSSRTVLQRQQVPRDRGMVWSGEGMPPRQGGRGKRAAGEECFGLVLIRTFLPFCPPD